MKPQNSYLIIEAFEERTEEVLESGIIVPTSIMEDKDTTAPGTIKFVSDGSSYKKDQIVLFNKFIPVQFQHEKKKYWAIKESDIICIL